MSTPEERLAALLRDTDIPVRGDGLSRIQARIARRRWTRWVAPVAALATGGVAASVLVLAGPADRDTLTVQPGDTPAAPSAFPGVCPNPQPYGYVCPTGSPTPSQKPGSTYGGAFVWPEPRTPGSAIEAWRKDPLQVAERFVTDYLKLDGITVSSAADLQTQGRDVQLRVNGAPVSRLTMGQLDGLDQWVVTRAIGTGARLSAPAVQESVSSPLQVRGTLDHAVDDNVLLRLLIRDGTQLAQTSAPAGNDAPWSGTLMWSDTSWSSGAVVGVTRSNKDGAVTRVFVQPVVRATGAEDATFMGIVDGHVSAISSDGSVGRQLTYPPAGSEDVEASFNGTSALVVRRHPPNRGSCDDSLIRVDGTEPSLVDTGNGSERLTTPRISPSGTWEAWITTACPSGKVYLAQRHGQGTVAMSPVPDGQTASVSGVRDDGFTLLRLGTTGSYVELLQDPSVGPSTDSRDLLPNPGCEVTAPAFDGPRIVAWETCGSKVHFVRYSESGARTSTDPDVPLSDAPVRTSVNSGRVLVWLFGGDTVGEIARYQDGALTTVVPNTGCTSVSEPKGCVRDPSW